MHIAAHVVHAITRHVTGPCARHLGRRLAIRQVGALAVGQRIAPRIAALAHRRVAARGSLPLVFGRQSPQRPPTVAGRLKLIDENDGVIGKLGVVILPGSRHIVPAERPRTTAGIDAGTVLAVGDLVGVDREGAESDLSLGNFVTIFVAARIIGAHGGIGIATSDDDEPRGERDLPRAKIAGTSVVDVAVTIVIDGVACLVRAGMHGRITVVAIAIGRGSPVAILIDAAVAGVAIAVAISVGLVRIHGERAVVANVSETVAVAIHLQRLGHVGAVVGRVVDPVVVAIVAHANRVGTGAVFVDAVVTLVDCAGKDPRLGIFAIASGGREAVTVVIDLITGKISSVAILVDPISASLRSAGFADDIVIVAVALKHRETITISVDRIATEIDAIAVLVDSVLAGLPTTRLDLEILVVAVAVGRADAVAVLIGFTARRIDTVTILIDAVFTDIDCARIDADGDIVAVAFAAGPAVAVAVDVAIDTRPALTGRHAPTEEEEKRDGASAISHPL